MTILTQIVNATAITTLLARLLIFSYAYADSLQSIKFRR